MLAAFLGWSFWNGHIIYLTADGAQTGVETMNLATRAQRRIHTLDIDPATFWLTGMLDVSADGEWIAFSNTENQGSDLMLVENAF